MEYTVDTAILKEAVVRANRAVSVRTPLDSIKGLLLQLNDYTLAVTGGNTTMSITTSIPVTAVSGVGEKALIDAKLLTGIASKLPDGVVSVRVTGDKTARITCERSSYDIACMNPDDYPAMFDDDNGDTKTVNIEQSVFSKLIATTSYAASDKDTRPVYTGIKLDFNGDSVTAAAVDGFRLAVAWGKLKEAVPEPFGVIIPATVMAEVAGICGLYGTKDENLLKLVAGEKCTSFSTDAYRIESRLLDGNFLDYNQTLAPTPGSTTHTLYADDLATSVGRIAVVIDDTTRVPARLTFKNDAIELEAVTATGRATDTCAATGSGVSETTGFNVRYLTDVLKCCKGQRVTMMTGAPTSPAFIYPDTAAGPAISGDSGWTHMLLPVRLRA